MGIIPSHSRPKVSNDNEFAESIFKTVKYCPQWPLQRLMRLEDSRQWVLKFERFYNNEHRLSSILFVTPAQRYEQRDQDILNHRKQMYTKAREANPTHWSGDIRDWEPVGVVALDPLDWRSYAG